MEWFELIEATEKSDWSSPDNREYVKSGLVYLREFFGEQVLAMAMQCHRHYFTETFNLAPWNLLRYAEFGHRLKDLSKVPNASYRFEQLRKAATTHPDRGNIENFFGLFNEVEVVYPFVKQGIATEFFQETSTPTPDLKLKIDGRWLNIEITNLRDPASYWDAEKFKERLRDTILENFSTEPYLIQLGIGRLWNDIKNSQNEVLAEIIEEIRHLLNSSPMEDQVNLRGIQIQLYRMGSALSMIPPEGPQWIIKYPQKIRKSIRDKSKQLRVHGPAVIVICDSVFNCSDIPRHLPSITQFIAYLIKSKPHISGVMLVFDKTSMRGLNRWSIGESDLLFAQYVLCDGTRHLSKLLVPNFSAKELLTPTEIDSLLAYPDMI